jgi:hypothetical protein
MGRIGAGGQNGMFYAYPVVTHSHKF